MAEDWKSNMSPEQIREEEKDDGDVIALIVLDEFPIETINKILGEERNAEYICLADSYDNIPDREYRTAWQGTSPNVDASWKAPFSEKTVQDAVAWMRGIPKSKPVNRKYCAVLSKDSYEHGVYEAGDVFICKWLEDGEPQTIRWAANDIGTFHAAFEREMWDEYHDA